MLDGEFSLVPPKMSLNHEYKILVTGGSGFLGRAVIRMLLERYPHWKVSSLDIRPPDQDVAQQLDRVMLADIRQEDSVKAAFKDYHPDLVVHTAGVVPARAFRYSTKDVDWQHVKAVNYDGTRNVLLATMASGCMRFVYTSSVTAIIDDLDHDYYYMDESVPLGLAQLHYGKSKGMAETFVLSSEHAEKGLKACALRPCTILGPDDTQVISVLHDCIGKGETYFVVGDGNNIYDWMYIDNAAHAHVLAIKNLLTSETAAGEAFFITNQEPAYFWDFLAFIWAQFGHKPAFQVHVPVALAMIVAFVLEWFTWALGLPITLDTGSVKDGIRTHYASNEKAIHVLGYRPTVGLTEGVVRSCQGYKRHLAAKMTAKNAKEKPLPN